MAASNPNKNKKLLDFLVTKNLLKAEDTALLLQRAGEKNGNLDEILSQSNLINQEDYIKAKAEFLNLPYANLLFTEVPQNVLDSLPAEIAENYRVVAFDKQGNKLSVGMVDFDNFKAISAIDFLANKNNLQVEYFLISDSSFANIFKQYKRFTEEISSALKVKAEEEKKEGEENKEEQAVSSSFEEVVKNAPVSKIVSEIIKHAVEAGASDIHIEPLDKETRVRYRIDGILHSSLSLPKNIHESIVARIKVLSNLKLDETRVPQGGRIRLTVSNKDIDFRVSVLPLMGYEKVVMRVLDTTKGMLTLEQLGYQGTNLEAIKKNITKTVGIILVTGPTGSGKSTTLYSVLNILNREGVNIVTLEDPVEYYVEGVNQSQIRPEIGFTFASGLRSLLRQDPDVMMVGEIRDNETAELAIHAALTGHLVLSTLHTNDAIGAIPRLLDMKIEPFLLGSVLNMVVAQRLARRLCNNCKKEKKLPPKMLEDLQTKLKSVPEEILLKNIPDYDPNNIKVYEPVGCVRCNKTGYRSRVAVAEVLDVDDYIRDTILTKNGNLTEDEVRKDQPFININQDGIIKVVQGLTSLEEVIRVMNA